MIDGLKPYPKMKDSGVPWLGEVPEHWGVLPPKRVLWSRSSGSAPIKNTASAEQRSGYVPAFSASGQDVWLPKPMFRGPGLVLSAVGARCGKTFRADGAWAIVANTHVLLVKEGHHRDFWWYVTNDEVWWERAGAAQPFVQVGKTLDRPWIVPPPDEQAAIVRFLDHADRKIRRYIRAKQKLIKLLEEQKQAIIQRAVTRGLDPNVCLKPSGVEWLGDVPAHWEMVRLKHLCRGSALYGANVQATSYTASGVRFLRTTDITEEGHLRVGGVFLPEESVRGYLLNDGDLLLSRSGTIGRSLLYQSKKHGPCAYAGYLVRFVPNQKANPEYLFKFTKTQAFARFLGAMAISSTIENVNGDKYANCVLSLPPLPEQADIVRHLDAATAPIALAIEQERREGELLREYRTRLLADVVTGKLDVREAAARVPDKVTSDCEQEDAGLEVDQDVSDVAGEVEVTTETEA